MMEPSDDVPEIEATAVPPPPSSVGHELSPLPPSPLPPPMLDSDRPGSTKPSPIETRRLKARGFGASPSSLVRDKRLRDKGGADQYRGVPTPVAPQQPPPRPPHGPHPVTTTNRFVLRYRPLTPPSALLPARPIPWPPPTLMSHLSTAVLTWPHRAPSAYRRKGSTDDEVLTHDLTRLSLCW